MSSVKLSNEIVTNAKAISKVFNRSVAGQIEYWAKIGKIAEENSDLSFDIIKNILLAKIEVKSGISEKFKLD